MTELQTAEGGLGARERARLGKVVGEQPYPLLFATVSGAHLYGFSSPDSDWDLRGVHILPLDDVLGLEETRDTIEIARDEPGFELDLVTHDARKFFGMILKRNGYVLEQLFSPLVVHAVPEFEELRDVASRCVTRHHAHHYRGFAHNQWGLFEKEEPRRVKPLLYVFRVLFTGIHLLRTGQVEANLTTLNASFQRPFVNELIARKQSGERATLDDADTAIHRAEFGRLLEELEAAEKASPLPEAPAARGELSELLVRVRKRYGGVGS